jgi:hypothetical protein
MKADGGIGSVTPLILISALVYSMLLPHYIRQRHTTVSLIDGVRCHGRSWRLEEKKILSALTGTEP